MVALGSFASGPGNFGRRSSAVTPSDSTDLPGGPVKAVVALTAGGNLSVIPADNATAVAFVDVAPGFRPPFMVRRVLATGTTCTVATVAD